MLIAEALVETQRSSWYLAKLCQQFDRKAQALPEVNYKGQAHPEVDARVEWSADRGMASFGWGRCVLRADPGALALRAEAPDEESLQRVEQLVGDHLERFGRREHLTVKWALPHAAIEEPADTVAGHIER